MRVHRHYLAPADSALLQSACERLPCSRPVGTAPLHPLCTPVGARAVPRRAGEKRGGHALAAAMELGEAPEETRLHHVPLETHGLELCTRCVWLGGREAGECTASGAPLGKERRLVGEAQGSHEAQRVLLAQVPQRLAGSALECALRLGGRGRSGRHPGRPRREEVTALARRCAIHGAALDLEALQGQCEQIARDRSRGRLLGRVPASGRHNIWHVSLLALTAVVWRSLLREGFLPKRVGGIAADGCAGSSIKGAFLLRSVLLRCHLARGRRDDDLLGRRRRAQRAIGEAAARRCRRSTSRRSRAAVCVLSHRNDATGPGAALSAIITEAPVVVVHRRVVSTRASRARIAHLTGAQGRARSGVSLVLLQVLVQVQDGLQEERCARRAGHAGGRGHGGRALAATTMQLWTHGLEREASARLRVRVCIAGARGGAPAQEGGRARRSCGDCCDPRPRVARRLACATHGIHDGLQLGRGAGLCCLGARCR
mmetsp:Transcript_27207/g.73271  ORF Transcript_27207/g.73271 Transcript_27207/m.73271 type:complete len:486 (+) Transcript_27207:1491-2948(+)